MPLKNKKHLTDEFNGRRVFPVSSSWFSVLSPRPASDWREEQELANISQMDFVFNQLPFDCWISSYGAKINDTSFADSGFDNSV